MAAYQPYSLRKRLGFTWAFDYTLSALLNDCILASGCHLCADFTKRVLQRCLRTAQLWHFTIYCHFLSTFLNSIFSNLLSRREQVSTWCPLTSLLLMTTPAYVDVHSFSLIVEFSRPEKIHPHLSNQKRSSPAQTFVKELLLMAKCQIELR
jgi:hypothetical protein